MDEHLQRAVPVPGKLAVASAAEDRAVTVSLAGELDLGSSSDLEQKLEASLASGAGKVVVDLAGLEFIDSTGLRVLLSTKRRADGAGSELLLRNPQPQVRRLFEIAGVLELLSVESD